MGPAAHHLHHANIANNGRFHNTTIEPMQTISTVLSIGRCPTGFFCFASCPFLDAWALASLAWSAKRCWAGVTVLSHLGEGLELELGA
eukprot:1157232-Pelagomonas_calceolata.AAC.3